MKKDTVRCDPFVIRARRYLSKLVTRLGLEPRTQRLRVGSEGGVAATEGELKQPKDEEKAAEEEEP